MPISIESFGGKPYKKVCEVLKKIYNTDLLAGITDELSLIFNADDRMLKNIDMDDTYIQCEEYSHVAIMPNFAAWGTILAGTIGTLDLEYQLYTQLEEGGYELGVHQCSMFPGHYEYDNSGSGSDYDDMITRSKFEHADYFAAAQVFELPAKHLELRIHLTKENSDLLAGQVYELILWFIP